MPDVSSDGRQDPDELLQRRRAGKAYSAREHMANLREKLETDPSMARHR
jgi:hypothetical protein